MDGLVGVVGSVGVVRVIGGVGVVWRLLVGELGRRLLVDGWWFGDFWWETRLEPGPSLTQRPTSGTLHSIPAHAWTLNFKFN